MMESRPELECGACGNAQFLFLGQGTNVGGVEPAQGASDRATGRGAWTGPHQQSPRATAGVAKPATAAGVIAIRRATATGAKVRTGVQQQPQPPVVTLNVLQQQQQQHTHRLHEPEQKGHFKVLQQQQQQ